MIWDKGNPISDKSDQTSLNGRNFIWRFLVKLRNFFFFRLQKKHIRKSKITNRSSLLAAKQLSRDLWGRMHELDKFVSSTTNRFYVRTTWKILERIFFVFFFSDGILKAKKIAQLCAVTCDAVKFIYNFCCLFLGIGSDSVNFHISFRCRPSYDVPPLEARISFPLRKNYSTNYTSTKKAHHTKWMPSVFIRHNRS